MPTFHVLCLPVPAFYAPWPPLMSRAHLLCSVSTFHVQCLFYMPGGRHPAFMLRVDLPCSVPAFQAQCSTPSSPHVATFSAPCQTSLLPCAHLPCTQCWPSRPSGPHRRPRATFHARFPYCIHCAHHACTELAYIFMPHATGQCHSYQTLSVLIVDC